MAKNYGKISKKSKEIYILFEFLDNNQEIIYN
jgi:hypothetical protein